MTDRNLQLVWLRNDLRLHDNPALYGARQAGPVVACFALTPEQWLNHGDSPAKLGLARDLLCQWQASAQALGIPLKVVRSADYSGLPEALVQLALHLKVAGIWWNREYPINELQRDAAVRAAALERGLAVREYDGDLVLPPGSVVNGDGAMYQVFTPFARRWRQRVTDGAMAPLPKPKKQADTGVCSDSIPPFGGDYRSDLWPAKADAIARRLRGFCQHKVADYTATRDLPGQPGTSLLSPYLALGAVGVRQCIAQALQQGPSAFAGQWLTELIWREFYRHLLVSRPELAKGRCFRPAGERVAWAEPDHFSDWQQGQTGVPIVDAGMRQLLQTGWMHNRVRMIVAAFLSKLMLVDWHLGEAHFMAHLIDGDFASNNGGWQWSASVGADAAPYFRIFNPYRQAERFDPEGHYVRKFVPELASLPGKKIHQPSAEQCRALNYPLPVIDYSRARAQALETFAAAFKGQGGEG